MFTLLTIIFSASNNTKIYFLPRLVISSFNLLRLLLHWTVKCLTPQFCIFFMLLRRLISTVACVYHLQSFFSPSHRKRSPGEQPSPSSLVCVEIINFSVPVKSTLFPLPVKSLFALSWDRTTAWWLAFSAVFASARCHS